MVVLRRAYRGWFLKRLAWLIPGFLVCCIIGGRVLLDSAGSPAASIPSLAIVAGSLLLFGTLFFRCVQVFRRASLGDRARARTLRRVLRPYRELSMAGIAAVLSLAAIPLLFEGPRPVADVAVLRPTHGRPVARKTPEDFPVEVATEAPLPNPAPPAPPGSAAPAPPPPPAPAAPLPDLPRLQDDPFLTPLPLSLSAPTLAVQDTTARGREDSAPPQRPEVLDFTRALALPAPQPFLDRGGLPYEEDATTLPLRELSLDVTIVPNSGGWKGSIYELSFELPLSRSGSLRMTYSAAAMNKSQDDEDFEATLAWHRMSLSYELKLAGYTRHATFDLAIRLGGTVDVLSNHISDMAISETPRISPWIGVEAAVWEQSGFGVILQGGYSVAAPITGGSAAVGDLRLLVRYDMSENLSVYLGYRYIALRLHDRSSAEDGPPREDLHEQFSGPIVGVSLRF
jgi:hypothetical protein